MLSKGTELFKWEGEFFKLKQRWINQEMDEDKWQELFDDMNVLLKKYSHINITVTTYCLRHQIAFIEFMDNKAKGVYK